MLSTDLAPNGIENLIAMILKEEYNNTTSEVINAYS
jgi:hypothetical protein